MDNILSVLKHYISTEYIIYDLVFPLVNYEMVCYCFMIHHPWIRRAEMSITDKFTKLQSFFLL